MSDLLTHEAIRNDLHAFVRRRLLGPGGAADLHGRNRLIDSHNPAAEQPEILRDTPTNRYYTGIIYPPARLSEAPPTAADGPEVAAEEAEFEAEEDAPLNEGASDPAEAAEIRPLAPGEADADTEEAADDDDLLVSAGSLPNFSQLYPRHIGLSVCVAANTPAATLCLSYRRYEVLPTADKRRVALLLTDYPTNPHYQQLLTGPEYGAVLGRFFALRTDHAAGPLLVVRELPVNYAEIDSTLTSLRRKTDPLFRGKSPAAAASEEESDGLEAPTEAATEVADRAMLKEWDRLRYAADPAQRSSADFDRIQAQVTDLQQLYYAYQAFRHLAMPLRSTDTYNDYWLEHPESVELPLPLAEYRPLLRQGRYDKLCWVIDANGRPDQRLSLGSPDHDEAHGHRLRVRLLLRQDARRSPNELFVKVQVENFSLPVTVHEGGPYPSFAPETALHSFFGLTLKMVVSTGLCAYRGVSGTGLGAETLAEDRTTKFIYRNAPPYAIGHGVAAEWPAPDDQARITWAATTYLPCKDVPEISPKHAHPLTKAGTPVLTDDEVLRLQWLADFGPNSEATDAQVLAGLQRFLAYYQYWITCTRDRALASEKPELHAQINAEMTCCQLDLDRMSRNVQLLDEHRDTGLRAFRLANAAMFVQLWHGRYAGKQVGQPGSPDNPVFQAIKKSGQAGFSAAFYAGVSDKLRPPEQAAWRPFQLAFMLLNVDGFLRPTATSTQQLFDLPTAPTNWYERNELADLVWFPTGGGKTEAYLGLIAFCALHRRIAYPGVGGGTAVLMRYTLRLLTLQQFQRATRLLVALEIVRHWPAWHKLLSAEPNNPGFSVGLWVGSKFLPNKLKGSQNADGKAGADGLLDQAEAVRAALRERQQDYRRDPSAENLARQVVRARAECGKIPMVACPCCGSDLFDVVRGEYGGPLGLPHENAEDDGNGSQFHCLAPGCLFGPPADAYAPLRPLPIRLCDELLYQRPPTLLFGTVDKFAALAHKVNPDEVKDDTRRLFGLRRPNGRPKQPNQRPPDLIIQDELHLLQGPLGSSVALFEIVLDQLCRVPENNGATGFVRAKVISSTATTRNTGLQVWALYDRQVNVFPKPGVEASDSFYAVYKEDLLTRKNRSIRRYLGIYPTGKTMMTTQRYLLGLLLAHRLWAENQALPLAPGQGLAHDQEMAKLLDAYYSVVAYFGSLREVGKTASQIDTFLQADYLRLFDELLLTQPLHYSYRYLRPIELTGRMNDNQVKAALVLAETPYSLESRRENRRSTPDLLLATSMISVGIDISRLNVMLVNGMPKSMAEYIQASSRVAREHPGLVLTLHHPMRPRDVSHFEHFASFHDRLYAYVEPLSITPFTAKALARYWPTGLAALIRQQLPEFAANTSAGNLTAEARAQIAQQLVASYFQARHERMNALSPELVGDDVRHLLGEEELAEIARQTAALLAGWEQLQTQTVELQEEQPELNTKLAFEKSAPQNSRLYADLSAPHPRPEQWPVNYSLREIEPQTALKIIQQ